MNKKIVFNFFESKITSIQRKQLEEWLLEPDNQEQFYAWLNEYESKNLQYEVDTEDKLKTIKLNLDNNETPIASKQDFRTLNSKTLSTLIAAAILILCIGFLFSIKNDHKVYKEVSDFVSIENNQNLKTIILPDQSSIVLQPNSKIQYSKLDFQKGIRTIYFEGDGFFEIKKDTLSPFIINTKYYNTKVLGTSFNLQTEGKNTENQIRVKTGRVAVFSTLNKMEANEAILLTANQELKFSKTFKSPVALINIHTINPKEEEVSYDFEDTAIIDILERLSKNYNVKIDYDYERLKSCKVTAKLSDEPLSEKVKLICLAINAQYEITENQINIKSYGCKN